MKIPNFFLKGVLLMLAGSMWSFLIRTPVMTALILFLAASVYFTGKIPFASSVPLPTSAPPVSASVEQAADKLAEQIAAACPEPEKSMTKLFIVPFDGDRNEIVENALRKIFQRNAAAGWYEIIDRSAAIKALEKVHFTFISKEYPAELVKLTGAEYVLTGKIGEFTPKDDSHLIAGSFRLLDLTKRQDVFSRQFSNESVKSAGNKTHYGYTFLRWFSVLLFTLIYPILLIPVIQKIIEKDNSGTNLAGMLGLAFIPVGVAMLLTGVLPAGAFSVIGYLVLFAASAAWVGFVMDKLAAKI
jgi:hypothetical protein